MIDEIIVILFFHSISITLPWPHYINSCVITWIVIRKVEIFSYFFQFSNVTGSIERILRKLNDRLWANLWFFMVFGLLYYNLDFFNYFFLNFFFLNIIINLFTRFIRINDAVQWNISDWRDRIIWSWNCWFCFNFWFLFDWFTYNWFLLNWFVGLRWFLWLFFFGLLDGFVWLR